MEQVKLPVRPQSKGILTLSQGDTDGQNTANLDLRWEFQPKLGLLVVRSFDAGLGILVVETFGGCWDFCCCFIA